MAGDPVLVAGASFVLLLVSAKAHGRQIRLEREREGHHHVVFGGANPPWVESLWAKDRRGYWTVAALAAFLGGPAAWLAGGWGPGLVVMLLWSPTAGFWAMGLVSLFRLSHRLENAPAAWRRQAVRGSLGWWGTAALMALGVAWASAYSSGGTWS